MPELTYPTASLDDRITMRGELAALRQDPAVVELRRTSREEGREVYGLTLEGALPYGLQRIVADRSTDYSPPNRFSVNRSAWSNPQPQVTIESITSLMREFEGVQNVHDEISVPRFGALSSSDQAEIIRRYVSEMAASSGTRRVRLAAQMVQPLRVTRDYQSIARRVLAVDELPDGALPIYDRDPLVWAATEEVGELVVNPNAIGTPSGFQRWPPVPLPAWCGPGVWIVRGDECAEIVDIADPTYVLALPLLIRQPKRIPRDEIEAWAPCLAPPVGKTRFERDFLV